MSTIQSSERGQLVEACDAYGTYYFLADSSGYPSVGGWTDRAVADQAWDLSKTTPPGTTMELEMYLKSDVELDDLGRRVLPCAYCNVDVPIVAVPEAADDAEWAEVAEDHADDCEWVLTRAHRVDPRPVQD